MRSQLDDEARLLLIEEATAEVESWFTRLDCLVVGPGGWCRGVAKPRAGGRGPAKVVGTCQGEARPLWQPTAYAAILLPGYMPGMAHEDSPPASF